MMDYSERTVEELRVAWRRTNGELKALYAQRDRVLARFNPRWGGECAQAAEISERIGWLLDELNNIEEWGKAKAGR